MGDGAKGEPFRAHLSNELAEVAAEVCGSFGLLSRRGALHDDSAAATAKIEPTFGGQQPIGFGDGIEVDAEFEAEFAHRGQSVAGLQSAVDEQGADVVNHLSVNGDGRSGIDDEFGFGLHLLFVYVQCTNRRSQAEFELF